VSWSAQAESAAHGAPQAAKEGVDIIGHVANGPHPLFHLPTVYGIDLSVTKHVFMLWVVAAILFVGITMIVRAYLRRGQHAPAGPSNVLEVVVGRRADDVFVACAADVGLVGDVVGVVARIAFVHALPP